MFATPVYAAADSGAEQGAALFTLFGLEVTSVTTTAWGLALVLALVGIVATRKLERIPTSRLQVGAELLLDTLIGFFGDVMGSEEKAKRYLPLLGTFFLFILMCNYSGLIPGVGLVPGMQTPTSTLSVTAAFAAIVFFFTHYYGFRENGWSYIKHFTEPIILLLPLNLLGEFTKPLSLSLRLFGNIYGEGMVVAGLFSIVPILVPVPLELLSMLLGFIQALVFTLLASVYIASATSEP
ncbi:MAG TPA: F0F1 ATP synthase subunit A [Clostridia bacterium]|nr:F0F1 ATP synthase subunit A [Clostridia bacterium]